MTLSLKHWSSLALLAAAATGCGTAADAADQEALLLEQSEHEAICLTCEDYEPTPLPTPSPVAAPAFVMEFEGCGVSDIDFKVRRGPLLAATVAALKGADLSENGNGDLLKTADYKAPSSIFMTDICRNNKHIFGTWIERLGALGASDTAAARKTKLGALSVAAAGEALSFRVQPSAVNQLVNFAWADIPKKQNLAGEASSNGPIFLDSAAASYPSSSSLKITVKGHANTSVGSIPFTATLLDTMALTSVKWLSCNTDVDLDLEGFTGNLLEFANAIFSFTDDPAEELAKMLSRGPACRAIDALEQDPLIPDVGLKTIISLSRLSSSASTGVTIAGNTEIAPRKPLVTMGSPEGLLFTEYGESVTAKYRVYTDDIALPLKSIKWSATDTTISAPYSESTNVTWHNVSVAPNTTTYRTLYVTVVDAENKTTTGTKKVGFRLPME